MRKLRQSVRTIQLLVFLAGATLCWLSPGCGHKRTLVGEEFSARPELLTYNHFGITGGTKRFHDHVSQYVVRNLPSAKSVTSRWISEKVDRDSLATIGRHYGIDAVIFCTTLNEPVSIGRDPGDKNYSRHRLTMRIIDTNTGEEIGYGSSVLYDYSAYLNRVTIRALAERVLDGIIQVATTEHNDEADQ